MSKPLTYISLFSSAGVGCFGFKQNGFECIATNEILTKRLKIQAFNNKCKYETGYLDGDISTKEIKNKLFAEIKKWQTEYKISYILHNLYKICTIELIKSHSFNSICPL